mmetsp:Transcript_25323/g.35360  ORF Transcript_25323/g.35360 Transcript_25323/m.35360 type:complete len:96 (-) Transcript_25323:32-319(-)
MLHDDIEYSEKYCDCKYEYRHVILPREMVKQMPRGKLLSDEEWRRLGVQQSRGWVHYEIHTPEPHILLFRRKLGTDPKTGKVDLELRRAALSKQT